MQYTASSFLNDITKHGESIWWDESRKMLLWLDCFGKKILLYHPELNQLREVAVKENLMALIPLLSGGYLGVEERRVYRMDEGFQKIELLYEIPDSRPNVRFNDCKCGPDGALYLGEMSTVKNFTDGALIRLDREKNVRTILSGVGISNGFVWSRDEKTLYYTDTVHGEIYGFDWKNGSVSNKRTVFYQEGAMPDGMCIDENGNIWAALWGDKKVVGINPKTGKVEDTVAVSALQPSSVVFGGMDGKTMYITTSQLDMSKEQLEDYKESGKLFQVSLPIRGIRMYKGDF